MKIFYFALLMSLIIVPKGFCHAESDYWQASEFEKKAKLAASEVNHMLTESSSKAIFVDEYHLNLDILLVEVCTPLIDMYSDIKSEAENGIPQNKWTLPIEQLGMIAYTA